MKFLANLFGAGHEGKVRYALRKQKAVRWYRRAVTVGDVDMAMAERMLREADCTTEEAEAIYRLTSLCTFDDRFVIPPMHREEAIEMLETRWSTSRRRGSGSSPVRGGSTDDGTTAVGLCRPGGAGGVPRRRLRPAHGRRVGRRRLR